MKYVIHCGLTKTGSTSIQAMLAANAGPLRERGYLYPTRFRGQQVRRHAFVREELEQGGDAAAAFVRESLDAARQIGASTIVWSDEGLAGVTPSRIVELKAVLERIGEAETVKAVFYHRNLYDRLLSQLNQQTKAGDKTLDGASAQRLAFNPSEQVRAWEAALGPANVEVRIYDAALREGLENDFLRAIGIDDPGAFEKPPPFNRSLDPITTTVISMVRTEWGLPKRFALALAKRTRSYPLPALKARLVEPLHEVVAAIDITHPKLAAHRELLTAPPIVSPSARPSLDDFVSELKRTLDFMVEYRDPQETTAAGTAPSSPKPAGKPAEDRLAQALRANLRRRKAAANPPVKAKDGPPKR